MIRLLQVIRQLQVIRLLHVIQYRPAITARDPTPTATIERTSAPVTTFTAQPSSTYRIISTTATTDITTITQIVQNGINRYYYYSDSHYVSFLLKTSTEKNALGLELFLFIRNRNVIPTASFRYNPNGSSTGTIVGSVVKGATGIALIVADIVLLSRCNQKEAFF